MVVECILRPYNPQADLYHHQHLLIRIMEETDYWPALWQALYDNGASAKHEEGTRRFWDTLSPEAHKRAFTTITGRLKEGKFVWYDPIRAIKEALRRKSNEKQQMSFAEYYAKYGTTEERDRWEMRNPTGKQVIYVKNVR